MSALNLFPDEHQEGLNFPAPLTEKYRPITVEAFLGLREAKDWARGLLRQPRPAAAIFQGKTGMGKTALALAIASQLPAQLLHIPAGKCRAETLDGIFDELLYCPRVGRFHLCLFDEIDQASGAAQNILLSKLDSTATLTRSTMAGGLVSKHLPPIVYIFTTNDLDKLEARFVSRCEVLAFGNYGVATEVADFLDRVWHAEGGNGDAPNFARIVKEQNANVRGCLQRLQTLLTSRSL